MAISGAAFPSFNQMLAQQASKGGVLQGVIDAMLTQNAAPAASPIQQPPMGNPGSGTTQMSVSGGAGPQQAPQQAPQQQFAQNLEPGMPQDLQRRAMQSKLDQQRIIDLESKGSVGGVMAGFQGPEVQQEAIRTAQEMAAWEKQQDDEKKMAVADRIYQLAVAADYKPENARILATQAMNDPKAAEEVINALTSRNQQQAEWGREDTVEAKTEGERLSGYTAFGIPKSIAQEMARNEDMSIPDGVKLYYEQQELDAESKQRRWDTMTFQGQQMDKIDNSIRQADRTLSNISPWSAGFASLSKIVPGSPAYDLMTQLDTQRATIAFRELKAMREASKTGGALGNVSNREIELLYSSFAPLKEGMSPTQLRTSVNDILNNFEQIKWILENEARYQQQVESGQMTLDEAAEAMREERKMTVNQSMAARNRTPTEALQALMEKPETMENFEKMYNWRPNL